MCIRDRSNLTQICIPQLTVSCQQLLYRGQIHFELHQSQSIVSYLPERLAYNILLFWNKLLSLLVSPKVQPCSDICSHQFAMISHVRRKAPQKKRHLKYEMSLCLCYINKIIISDILPVHKLWLLSVPIPLNFPA